MSLHPPIRDLKLCYVTDRKSLAGSTEEQPRLHLLQEKIENVASTGVDYIQIREKDLSGKQLSELVSEAVRHVPHSCKILVNDRLDVALTAGAGGVHLGEKSMLVQEAKRLLRERGLRDDFLIGASIHSIDAAVGAESAGADYIVFGPVFETPSKAKFGTPQGTQTLAEICRQVSIPVIAIGGITPENAAGCVRAGATGIAAIRIFQNSDNVGEMVRRLRGD